MWSFGRFNLRLSEADFGRLTLRQFNALAERYNDEQRRSDIRAASVVVKLHNLFCQDKISLDDLLGDKPRAVTPDDSLAVLRMYNAAFGGEEVG